MTARALVLALLLSSLTSSARAKEKAALMPLAAKNVAASTVEIMDALLAVEVERAGRFSVIGVNDVNAMLGLERMKDASGCNDVACAAELGGALGVEFLIVGTVGKLGDELIMQLTLIDIQGGRVEKRGQANVPADERHYRNAVQNSVASLFGLEVAPTTPTRKLSGAPLSPLRVRFDSVEPGRVFNVRVLALDGLQHDCPAPLSVDAPCSMEKVALGEAQIVVQSSELAPMSRTYDFDDVQGTVLFSVWEAPSAGSVVAWALGGTALGTGIALLAVGLGIDQKGLVYGGVPTAVVGAGVVGLGFTFDGRVMVADRVVRDDGKPGWWPF